MIWPRFFEYKIFNLIIKKFNTNIQQPSYKKCWISRFCLTGKKCIDRKKWFAHTAILIQKQWKNSDFFGFFAKKTMENQWILLVCTTKTMENHWFFCFFYKRTPRKTTEIDCFLRKNHGKPKKNFYFCLPIRALDQPPFVPRALRPGAGVRGQRPRLDGGEYQRVFFVFLLKKNYRKPKIF